MDGSADGGRDDFWRDRRVLVTGGAGFVGSWLLRRLIRCGANAVALVCDPAAASPIFATDVAKHARAVVGAVEDLSLVERALNEHRSEVVFHLAARALVDDAERGPTSTFETNVRGAWNVLEACRRSRTVQAIVTASSVAVYRLPFETVCAEDAPLGGDRPYDVSKACADLIAMAYHRRYGAPVAMARCVNLYGGGDVNWSRLVPGTIRAVRQGRRPVIRGSGRPRREYLYIEDAVEAYLALARGLGDAAIRGEPFNFGTGSPLAVVDVVRRTLGAMGRNDLEPIVMNGDGEGPSDLRVSSEKALRVLGWRPAQRFDEGLSKTVDWYRRHFGDSGPTEER